MTWKDLSGYTRHDYTCPYEAGGECTCGLKEAQEAFKKASEPAEERPTIVVDLKAWNILLDERDSCYRALKDIIKHQELVAGTMAVHSSVLAIARPVVSKIEHNCSTFLLEEKLRLEAARL
jgi:hypothetical protein